MDPAVQFRGRQPAAIFQKDSARTGRSFGSSCWELDRTPDIFPDIQIRNKGYWRQKKKHQQQSCYPAVSGKAAQEGNQNNSKGIARNGTDSIPLHFTLNSR